MQQAIRLIIRQLVLVQALKRSVLVMVDFGGSDKPLKPSVLKKSGLYMFPTVVGAITFSYNLPGVSDLKLS